MAGIDKVDVALSILKIAIVVGALLNVTPIMVWVERRGSALIQDRVGPNRVGPKGLFQSVSFNRSPTLQSFSSKRTSSRLARTSGCTRSRRCSA